MAILDGLYGMARAAAAANRALDGSLGRLRAIDEVSRDLERRRPLGEGEVKINLVGPDGNPIAAGGPGVRSPNFAASSVGPVAGVPFGYPSPGPPLTVAQILQKQNEGGGGATDKASSRRGGGGSRRSRHSVKDIGTAQQPDYDINAIIARIQNVVPPARRDWDSRGPIPGVVGREIALRSVSEGFGNLSDLRWCAGWYIYEYLAQQSGADKASSSSSPGQHFISTGGVRRIQSTGPDGGADIGIRYDRGTQRPLSSPTSTNQGLNSVTRAVKDTGSAGVKATNEVVSAVKELTSVVRSGNSGLTTRAEGAP